jgi:YegS/Rv2252/BmrU family lipid kinase
MAGMRRGRRQLADVVEIFNRAGYLVQTYLTAGQGDAAIAAETMSEGMDLVVCAGGDGTFNETVAGLLRSGRDIPIGYLPCGSTNDFANSLKLSSSLTRAARDIVEGAPVPVDVGLFHGRHFTYVASCGAFAKTSYTTPQSVKNALGHLAYLLEGLGEIPQIRPISLRLELENRVIEEDFLFCAISNSTSVGGILTLDPKQVDMSDGNFEVLLVREPRDAQEIAQCIRALQNQKYNCAMMTFLSTPKVTVRCDPGIPWTLDGEKADGGAEITIENCHHAIRLMKKG